MGAGCYYTLPDNRDIKAYWVDVEIEEEDQDDETAGSFYYDLLIEDLKDCLLELPLCTDYNGQLYYGKQHKVDLDSTYYGDGILINLVIDLYDYDEKYNFVLSNLERVYNKIIRHVNQRFELRKASSGWTSCTIERGAIK